MQVLVDKIVEVPVNVYVDVPEYRDKRVKKVRERARERERERFIRNDDPYREIMRKILHTRFRNDAP
jgi:hypothetical protein